MAHKRQLNTINTLTGEVIDANPTPPQIKLNSANEVRREMARVYREARAGIIDTTDGSKFIFMLAQISKAIELTVIEERITELEKVKYGNA